MEEKATHQPGLLPITPASPAGEVNRRSRRQRQPEIDAKALREFRQRLVGRLAGTLEGRTDISNTPEMRALLSQRLATIYRPRDSICPIAFGYACSARSWTRSWAMAQSSRCWPTRRSPRSWSTAPTGSTSSARGKLTQDRGPFDDDDHVLRIIERIVRPAGPARGRKSPMVDARLPDGSRVNAIIPPLRDRRPTITIRKFSRSFTVDDLIAFGSAHAAMAEFLQACVGARLNIAVSGGTGSGKTTLLNVLSCFIPDDERIVTIEDSAELQLHQEHVVRLETRPPNLEGNGRVTIRDLVRNALRMRPDRIVVGEVRGGEALDMLQAMNTGHDGSLTTVHANTPRDAIARLETHGADGRHGPAHHGRARRRSPRRSI